MSGAVGLDYNAVYLVADSLGVQMIRANLQKLQALEAEALSPEEHDSEQSENTPRDNTGRD